MLSPLNLVLGGVVALLAGANVTVATHAVRQGTCKRTRYGQLLGVAPAFLLGVACCAPTLLLAIGTSATAALLPLLLPIRSIFYPLTLMMLLITLVWGTHRITRRTS